MKKLVLTALFIMFSSFVFGNSLYRADGTKIYVTVQGSGVNWNYATEAPELNDNYWLKVYNIGGDGIHALLGEKFGDTEYVFETKEYGPFNQYSVSKDNCYKVENHKLYSIDDDKDIFLHIEDDNVWFGWNIYDQSWYGIPGQNYNPYATPTPTPIPTKTATRTWTPTRTPTFTTTPNKTWTPIKTLTPTKTITRTPTLTLTPTPTTPYDSFGVVSDPFNGEGASVDITIIIKDSGNPGNYPIEVASWKQTSLRIDEEGKNYFVSTGEDCWEKKETIGSAYGLGKYFKDRIGENSLLSGRSGGVIFERPIKNIEIIRMGAIPTQTPTSSP